MLPGGADFETHLSGKVWKFKSVLLFSSFHGWKRTRQVDDEDNQK